MTEQEWELKRRKILQFYGDQITALREQMLAEMIQVSKEFYRLQHRNGRVQPAETLPVEAQETPVEIVAIQA